MVIVGGGPAGAATAIALADLGIACLVLDKTAAGSFKPGETLPANARPLLDRLQLGRLLEAPQHTPYTGSTVVWGHPQPVTRHFIAEPYGSGWYLNRPFFDLQLQEVARDKGVRWLSSANLLGVELRKDYLTIQFIDAAGNPAETDACFAVDASGRSACLARKYRVGRQDLDRLTGYYALTTLKKTNWTDANFIEAVPDGWWYAAALNKDKLLIQFMTDAGMHQVSTASICGWLWAKLQQSKHLREILVSSGPEYLTQPGARPASTSYLDRIAGDHWLAVGDAACTYDPLSAYGVTAALGGALYASLAIRDQLAGDPAAIAYYAYVQQQTFNQCVSMLANQYALIESWKDKPFYGRRQAGPGLLI